MWKRESHYAKLRQRKLQKRQQRVLDAGTWLRCTYTGKHLQAGNINGRKISCTCLTGLVMQTQQLRKNITSVTTFQQIVRWQTLLSYVKGECLVDEKEIYEICQSVDAFIADYLEESIVKGTSYDLMEAHHGILPISRNCFYRRRRIVQRIIKQRLGRIEEEQNGQMKMVW